MTTPAGSERQARLIARKKADGEKRFEGWIPGELFDRLRQTYPTDLHKSPDWKRIGESALRLAEIERRESP